MTVAETLQTYPLFDVPVLRHGFSASCRDYVIHTHPPGEDERCYRFTHCVAAEHTTVLSDDLLAHSWDDVFLDPDAWEKADCPDGYAWGVNWAEAYPGLTHFPDSEQAQDWSERLGHEMHEVTIETNVYMLRLIFHGVKVLSREAAA